MGLELGVDVGWAAGDGWDVRREGADSMICLNESFRDSDTSLTAVIKVSGSIVNGDVDVVVDVRARLRGGCCCCWVKAGSGVERDREVAVEAGSGSDDRCEGYFSVAGEERKAASATASNKFEL